MTTTVIPGVSPAELDVMQAAAACFLGSPASMTVVATQLGALAQDASPESAGREDIAPPKYWRINGPHFMAMWSRAA
jgi:hypothetical protein